MKKGIIEIPLLVKRAFLLVLLALVLLGTTRCKTVSSWLVHAPTPTLSPNEVPGPHGSASIVDGVLQIPIGIGVFSPGDVAVFNQYAGPQDILAVRSQFIDLLKDVQVGQKMLVLGNNDEPVDRFPDLISQVKPQGVSILGYNLEKALPASELIDKEKSVWDLARQNDLLYVFGPTLLKLTQNYTDFAQNADVLLLQAQRFQASGNFENQVEDIIDQIRSSNPKVKVWVQVSVNPPDDPEIDPPEVIRQIAAVADKADLVWIFFAPDRASAMEEVLKGLRQSKSSQYSLATTLPNPSLQADPAAVTEITGTLCGYWTFTRPSELLLSDLRTYTNVVFYPQDAVQDLPNETDLSALRENNLKLVVKLDKKIVEETFDRAALEKFKTRLDQYRDVIYAVWPIDEPYKENRWKQYTFEQLEELVEAVTTVFPGYPIWVNFMPPTITVAQQNGFPGIPQNIDIVSVDIYLHSSELTEEKYKQFISDNLTLIKENAGARPVLFASRSFSTAGAGGTPLFPEQVDWDAELVKQFDLFGLAWYFFDDATPAEKGYGASHYPEILARQKEIGLELISTEKPGGSIPSTPTLEVASTPEASRQPPPPTPTGIIRHPLVVAVEQQTAQKYPDVQAHVESAVTYVNQLLTAGGIQREFYIDHFADVYDKNVTTSCKAREESGGFLPEAYCSHPGETVFVVVDESTSKNYPLREGPSVEWHGLKQVQASAKDNPHFLFIPDSLHVFAHELGHILGLPDLYLLRIAAEDNLVNGQEFPGDAYDPFEADIMYGGTFGNFTLWDKQIVDRENQVLPMRYNSWYDYQPRNTVLEFLSADGSPLPGADVKVYFHARTPEHKQVIDDVPEFTGQTDAAGTFSIGADILGPDLNDSVRVYLVETNSNGQVDYQWFSFIDVNFAYWGNQGIQIKTNLNP